MKRMQMKLGQNSNRHAARGATQRRRNSTGASRPLRRRLTAYCSSPDKLAAVEQIVKILWDQQHIHRAFSSKPTGRREAAVYHFMNTMNINVYQLTKFAENEEATRAEATAATAAGKKAPKQVPH